MESTIVLGIFLFLGILFVGFMMSVKIKAQKINFKYVYVNYVILFCLLMLLMSLLFAPGLLEYMMRVTGITTPTSLVFTLLLAYMFYTSFLQEIKIAKQNEQIEKLARVISIEKAKNRGNKK